MDRSEPLKLKCPACRDWRGPFNIDAVTEVTIACSAKEGQLKEVRDFGETTFRYNSPCKCMNCGYAKELRVFWRKDA